MDMAQIWHSAPTCRVCEHHEGSCDCAQEGGKGTQDDGEAPQNLRLTREKKRTPASRSLARVR